MNNSLASHNGRNIRLFLPDGSPGGIILGEIVNWTGSVIAGHRGKLKELLRRSELQRPGVYFLISQDNETDSPKAYIGESEAVGNRLRSHSNDTNKDFWDYTIIITNKDSNLTKAHVQYLENRLIDIANKSGRAKLQNSQEPRENKLPEADRSDMEYFIEQTRLILPMFNVNFLKPSLSEITEQSGEELLFELEVGEIHAQARQTDDGFFVLKDSLAKIKWEHESTEDSWAARRRRELLETGKLQKQSDGFARFMEDIPFKTPSGASAVVLARPDNGKTTWKVKGTRKTYREYYAEKID